MYAMPFSQTDTRVRGPLELKVDSVMRNHLEKPSNSIIGCSLGVSSFLWNAWEKPLNRFPCSTVQTRKPLKLSIWQILSCQSVIRPWFSSSSTCDQPWAQVSHSTRAQTCVRCTPERLCYAPSGINSHTVVQFVNFYFILSICHLWSNHDFAVTIHIWLTICLFAKWYFYPNVFAQLLIVLLKRFDSTVMTIIYNEWMLM